MPAVDYPWEPVGVPGVVTQEGFVPLDRPEAEDAESDDELDRRLRRAGAPGLADRHPVVGVGSNRNAEVLRRKFLAAGITPTLAVQPVAVDDIAVGHSAHVSLRGYLAAAPFVAPGVRTELTVAWVDDPQLAALDDTEPNYERIGLDPAQVSCPTGCPPGRPTGPSDVWIYRSRWGVIAGQDDRPLSPLPLGPQDRLQKRLCTVPGLAGAWSDRLGPAEVAGRLAEPELRERVRTALIAAGLALPSGLGDRLAP